MDEDDKSLAEALFPHFEWFDQVVPTCGFPFGADGWFLLQKQLTIFLLEDGNVDRNEYESELQGTTLTALLTRTIQELDDAYRVNLLLKVQVSEQCRDNEAELLDMLGEGESTEFKTYLATLSKEDVGVMMDWIFTDYFLPLFSKEEGAVSKFLYSRLAGQQMYIVVTFLQCFDQVEKRSFFLYPVILRLKRDRMSATELAQFQQWRESIFESTSEEVRSKYSALEEEVKEVILFDSIFAVAAEHEKQRLSKARGSTIESWVLDDFMSTANEEVTARVSSAVVEEFLKVQAQNTELTAPLDQSNEDRELLLSLLPHIPQKTKRIIRSLSPDQVDATLKDLHDTLVSKGSARLKKTAFSANLAAQLGGVTDIDKRFLRELAKDKRRCRQIFGNVQLQVFGHKTGTDVGLQQEYQRAKQLKKDDETKNPMQECTGCGARTPWKKLLQCSACKSALYCSKACQGADWKKSHKHECPKLRKAWILKSNPDGFHGEDNAQIPLFCLAVPSSLTGYPKEVQVSLPLWDLHDKKKCLGVQQMKCSQHIIVRNVEMFFKLEREGGTTSLEAVGNMCEDVFMLYLLGYKDVRDGKGVRLLCAAEVVDKEADFAMMYKNFSPVPKGWRIPAKDRPGIPPRDLAIFEKGIEWVRQRVGEREALL